MDKMPLTVFAPIDESLGDLLAKSKARSINLIELAKHHIGKSTRNASADLHAHVHRQPPPPSAAAAAAARSICCSALHRCASVCACARARASVLYRAFVAAAAAVAALR